MLKFNILPNHPKNSQPIYWKYQENSKETRQKNNKNIHYIKYVKAKYLKVRKYL